MIWSDMYYGSHYYDYEYDIPQSTIDGAPLNVAHVFWDYYHEKYVYYHNKFAQEERFGNEIVFGGGIWTWDGFLPNFAYSLISMTPALTAAIDHNVKTVLATMWCDGGGTDYLLALPHLAIFSEYCWLGKACTDDDIYLSAEYLGGESRELIDAVADYWAGLDGSHRIGTGILWGDLLLDTMCYDIDLDNIARLYEKSMKTLEKYKNTEYYKAVFDVTYQKCLLLRDLRREYLSGNREYIKKAANELIPRLCKSFETLRREHKTRWDKSYKRTGYERFAIRFGGIIQRLSDVAQILNGYADGKLDRIEELDAPRQKLNVTWENFNFYARM